MGSGVVAVADDARDDAREESTLNTKRKIALAVQYRGTEFRGFQRLAHARTVQGELDRALARMGIEEANVTGSSRTDAGAHAILHPVTFETDRHYPPETFVRALNAFLPTSIRILDAREVPYAFHPRANALYREYLYLMKFGEEFDPFLSGLAGFERTVPSPDDVRSLLASLVGTHDFRSFVKKSAEAENCVRTVMAADFGFDERSRTGVFFFRANGFMWGMIRSMIGAVLSVARGERTRAAFEELLAKPSDESIPTPVVAGGLYLFYTEYAPPLFERRRAAFPLVAGGAAAREVLERAGIFID